MKYSFSLAGFRTLIGLAVAILPSVITFLIARNYLDQATATLITSIVGIVAASLGVDAHAFITSQDQSLK